MAELRLQTAKSGFIARESYDLNTVQEAIQEEGLAWLDILRPDDDVRKFLLEQMEFDELAVEDVFGPADTTAQKFKNHRFIVINARDADNQLDTEPVAIFIKENLIITTTHYNIPALKKFRIRFKKADDEDLALGIDFLLYELLDAIADDWTPILNSYSRQLDQLEFQVFDPGKKYDSILESIHDLKRYIREASKSIESLNTVTMRLLKPNERLIGSGVERYFSDLHQLSVALVKRANNYSSGATSARDSYLSNISMQLAESNAQLTEVMTTLTIIGAIMLPLTLIAGIFGMNSEGLPITQIGGFWGIIGLMFLFAGCMLTFFWRRGWLKTYEQ
ncbi:MAG: magnesium transporter CorA family protein [Candidatus Poseidonia sp.]|nr:magnesium transporter CorA family protein [Poseidonia sp.]MBL6748180.1 magnesium transporter CorA family protein [Poseidonia sp.]MBL6806867.1 magnesium transporter CorA family protein [Poseidonia sp.]MBL6885453.1 magnesium transporter CorA family protein [Candidatus Poseidoniaceae archaeon]